MTYIGVWVLLLLFDPLQFNDPYRTPDILERTVAEYDTLELCEHAVQALVRGREPLGGLRVLTYECVPRESLERRYVPLDNPAEIIHQLVGQP